MRGPNNDEPPPQILIVDDDPDFCFFVAAVLERAGASPRIARDGWDAIRSVRACRPDLVLLDLGLPRIDGASLVELISHELDVPVVVVSGRTSRADVVSNLDNGADDYLVKPVHGDELTARVRAVLRRHRAERAQRDDQEVHDFGDLRIDASSKRVEVRGSVVKLTPREFDLLLHLARRPGAALSRSQLLRDVWHSSPSTSAASTVNEHVRRLRRKLEVDPSAPVWITTETGFGYRFGGAAPRPAAVVGPSTRPARHERVASPV